MIDNIIEQPKKSLTAQDTPNMGKKNLVKHYSELTPLEFINNKASIMSGYYENDCLYGLKNIPSEMQDILAKYILKSQKNYNLIDPKKLDETLIDISTCLKTMEPCEIIVQSHRIEANSLIKYFTKLLKYRFVGAKQYKPGLLTNPAVANYEHTAAVVVFHNHASKKLMRDAVILNRKKTSNKIPIIGLNNLVYSQEFSHIGYYNNFSQKSLRYLLWRLYNLMAQSLNLDFVCWNDFLA